MGVGVDRHPIESLLQGEADGTVTLPVRGIDRRVRDASEADLREEDGPTERRRPAPQPLSPASGGGAKRRLARVAPLRQEGVLVDAREVERIPEGDVLLAPPVRREGEPTGERLHAPRGSRHATHPGRIGATRRSAAALRLGAGAARPPPGRELRSGRCRGRPRPRARGLTLLPDRLSRRSHACCLARSRRGALPAPSGRSASPCGGRSRPRSSASCPRPDPIR